MSLIVGKCVNRTLVPLNDVLKLFLTEFPDLMTGNWTLEWSDGYGDLRFPLEGELIEFNKMAFNGGKVFSDLLKYEIRFVNAEFLGTTGLHFGTFDSAYHFVNASQEILERIASLYEKGDLRWEEEDFDWCHI